MHIYNFAAKLFHISAICVYETLLLKSYRELNREIIEYPVIKRTFNSYKTWLISLKLWYYNPYFSKKGKLLKDELIKCMN